MDKSRKNYNIVSVILIVISCFFGVCVWNFLRDTAVNFGDLQDQGMELIAETPASFLKAILLFGAVFLAVFAFFCWIQKRIGTRKTILAASILFAVFSLIVIFLFRYVPVADQILVSDCASQLNQGDDTCLRLKNYGYLISHQNQVGMVNLLRIFYALFGDRNYLSFQIFNVMLAVIGICWCGAEICRKLSQNEKLIPVYEVLVLICCPLLIYIPYLYNDLISTSLVMISIWLFLKGGKKQVLVSDLILAFAVILRSNAMIPGIGMMLATLLNRNQKGSWKLLQILLMILILWLGHFLSRLPYQNYLQGVPSIPALAYIAMGMQGRSGGFNGFNAEIYWKSGGDLQKMNQLCSEAITSSIQSWKADPDSFRTFNDFKFQTQWNSPMYECLEMVLYTSEGGSFLVTSLKNGVLRHLVQLFMKGFQFFFYVCMMIGTWKLKKKDENLSCIVYTIFGYFLFSMLWEAKARYILPSLIYGLPIAAMALWDLLTVFRNKITFGKVGLLINKQRNGSDLSVLEFSNSGI